MKIKRSILKELAVKFEGSDSIESQNKILIKITTARCARVSYTIVGEEGKPDNYENDIKLHDRLVASGHWSPFEHCARAMSEYERFNWLCGHETPGYGHEQHVLGWCGNFRGFIQYRKMFAEENKK